MWLGKSGRRRNQGEGRRPRHRDVRFMCTFLTLQTPGAGGAAQPNGETAGRLFIWAEATDSFRN